MATGLVTTAAAAPASTSATARRMEAMAAGALEWSGRPGSAVTCDIEGDNRQRGRKCRRGRAAYSGDRNVEAELGGAAAQKIRIADDIEWRHVEFGAPMPDRKRKVGADPGGLAERQCQWLHGLCFLSPICLSGILYSIMAARRKLSR